MSDVADWDEQKRLRREWYEKRTATMRDKYGVESLTGGPMCAGIRMIVSPWFYDEFGNRTRTVRAAE